MINNCFENNSAYYGDGGSILLINSYDKISFEDSNFLNNFALGSGGSIKITDNHGLVNMKNITFMGNVAK